MLLPSRRRQYHKWRIKLRIHTALYIIHQQWLTSSVKKHFNYLEDSLISNNKKDDFGRRRVVAYEPFVRASDPISLLSNKQN